MTDFYPLQLIRFKSSGALICAALLLSGCAGMQPVKTSESPETGAPQVDTRPDGSVRFETSSEEVAKLWKSAERARTQDRNEVALDLLYDALEIDPRNALVWSRAAEIQLDLLESALAENYANKSNAFAEDNKPLLYRNWLIIEHARNMRGDLLGVRSAHKKVQQYQYQ